MGRIFAFEWEDALEDLTTVTACLGEYNAAQTWQGGPDPYDYYTPDMYRDRFAIESGRRTKTSTFYGVCFDYAQVAWDRIKSYRNYYVNAGMKDNQWYIAANSDDEQYIILYDPVDASKSSYHLNGVPVVEKARYRVIPHRDGIGQPASNHAWIWIQHKNGTWYWLDPTWTDNTGYVCYGIVSNGEEIYLKPSSALCVNPFPSSLTNSPLPSKPQPVPSYQEKDPSPGWEPSPNWQPPIYSGGIFVVSLGYIFPTNLINTKSFDLGSLDNYGFSISVEDADYLHISGIIGLSYRKSTKREEKSSFETIFTDLGYKQKLISSVKSTTRKTLILELSLGWQLIPHIVLYGGGGIGLSYLTVEEERSKSSSSELAWQVQGGIRFNVMDFLYTRAQVAYLHTKELGLSLHLGFSLF